MALILKTQGVSADPAAPKLYRDVMVTHGTLFAHDYSNLGTLADPELSEGSDVFDLARESALLLGVDNKTENTGLTSDNITEGKGITPTGATGTLKGFIFNTTLLDYLRTNSSHDILFIAWAAQIGGTDGSLIRSFDGTNYGVTAIRLQSTALAGVVTLAVAGAGNAALPTAQGAVQVATHYKGLSLPISRYRNGRYVADGNTPTGWPSATGWGIGKIDGPPAATNALYRFIIEDLTVSGRDAGEVIRQDYEYVTAQHRYAGIEPRPFTREY